MDNTMRRLVAQINAGDYASGRPKRNFDTGAGIAFGVMSSQHEDLLHEAVDDISTNGDDLCYLAWKEESSKFLTDLLVRIWVPGSDAIDLIPELEEAAETVDMMIGPLVQAIADSLVVLNGNVPMVVEETLDALADTYFSDEAHYRWEDDHGHTVELCADGDVVVSKSPYYTLCREATACLANAGYLTDQPGSYKAYCLGPEWFKNEKPPYPVWAVDGDDLR